MAWFGTTYTLMQPVKESVTCSLLLNRRLYNKRGTILNADTSVHIHVFTHALMYEALRAITGIRTFELLAGYPGSSDVCLWRLPVTKFYTEKSY